MKLIRNMTLAVVVLLALPLGLAGGTVATQFIINQTAGVYDSWGIAGTDVLPGNYNGAAFDTVTGLGTFSLTFNSPGNYFAIAYLDLDMDNEFGSPSDDEYGNSNGGVPFPGLSWQMGSALSGDPNEVYYRTLDGNLTNGSTVVNPVVVPGDFDVAMVLGWNFNVAGGQTALLRFFTSTTAPQVPFYLRQQNPAGANPLPYGPSDVYYWTTLEYRGGDPTVPEPGTWLAVSSGLLLAGWLRRRR